MVNGRLAQLGGCGVCGPSSAIGLGAAERDSSAELKERLRKPGHLMGLMRGVLGGDAEVAAIVAANPAGWVSPLALLVTPQIAGELTMSGTTSSEDLLAGRRQAKVGDYDVDVLVGLGAADSGRPIAVLVSPWIMQHLHLYTRTLWHRH